MSNDYNKKNSYFNKVKVSPLAGNAAKNQVASNHTGIKQFNTPEIFDTRGVMKIIMDLMIKNSVYPQQIFALGGATSLLSHLIGNKYKTTDGIYGNLYIISIGPSGSGKDSPRTTIKDTADTLNISETVPDNVASAAGLEDYLESLDTPVLLLLIDEFGKFLQQKKSNEEFGITAILLKLYTSANSTYIKRLKADKKSAPIYNPYVSLYGTTTEETIQSALSESDSESGWVGRFLFLATDEARPGFQTKQQLQTPQSIIDWFNEMSDLIVVDYSKAASKKIKTYQTNIDDYLRSAIINPIERSASVRLVEMIKKLSLISSVSNNASTPQINIRDVDWAIAVTEYSRAYVKNVLTTAIENGAAVTNESLQINRCLDIIKRVKTYCDAKFIQATAQGYVPKRMLLKKINIRSKTLEPIINTLIERGDIAEIELTQGTHGINCESAYYII